MKTNAFRVRTFKPHKTFKNTSDTLTKKNLIEMVNIPIISCKQTRIQSSTLADIHQLLHRTTGIYFLLFIAFEKLVFYTTDEKVSKQI